METHETPNIDSASAQADTQRKIIPFPIVSSHEGGFMNLTEGGPYKLPTPDMSCKHFREICRNALTWYERAKEVAFILPHITFVDYLLYRMWGVQYKMYGNKAMDAYREAFHAQCPSVAKEDIDKQDMLFLDWFISEGYHTQPPLPRVELLYQAEQRPDLYDLF